MHCSSTDHLTTSRCGTRRGRGADGKWRALATTVDIQLEASTAGASVRSSVGHWFIGRTDTDNYNRD